MEETFNNYVLKKFPANSKRGTSGMIHTEFGRKIQDCLKNPESFSTQFRMYPFQPFSTQPITIIVHAAQKMDDLN